ncbi:MAG: (d)CMP kinase [Ignavibacteria bacterium]|nr:(d)CMP kinase [Ignavibacteria bacterium]
MKKIIIAIDGPAGSGKSTTARLVAMKLGYLYIDTGAMYRAVTYLALKENILHDTSAIVERLKKSDLRLIYKDGVTTVLLNEEDVSEQIRYPEINANVSFISKIKEVREELVRAQRKMGESDGIVMEGRDIGTVVLPHADLKIFMVAALQTRAQRRLEEFTVKGKALELDEVKANLAHRDSIDSSREINPLTKADDAIEVDTTHQTIEDQVNYIVELARQRMVKTGNEN